MDQILGSVPNPLWSVYTPRLRAVLADCGRKKTELEVPAKPANHGSRLQVPRPLSGSIRAVAKSYH